MWSNSVKLTAFIPGIGPIEKRTVNAMPEINGNPIGHNIVHCQYFVFSAGRYEGRNI